MRMPWSSPILTFIRGAIQDNFALTVQCQGGPYEGMHELVVRSDAPSKVAASLSRSEEFAVLQVAFNAGVTVPEPLWMCEDTEVLGAPFLSWGEFSAARLVEI